MTAETKPEAPLCGCGCGQPTLPYRTTRPGSQASVKDADMRAPRMESGQASQGAAPSPVREEPNVGTNVGGAAGEQERSEVRAQIRELLNTAPHSVWVDREWRLVPTMLLRKALRQLRAPESVEPRDEIQTVAGESERETLAALDGVNMAFMPSALRSAAKFLRDCRGTEPAEFFEEHARNCEAAASLIERGESVVGERERAERREVSRWQDDEFP